LRVVNLRDYTHDRHKTVDDKPFGGGPGMLLKPEPIFEAVENLANEKTRVQIEKDVGDSEFRSDQAKALDGDKDAAYRVAQMFKDGTNSLRRDERRTVQWLRLASELGNGIASYQLYLYYRDRKLDREAVRYENAAREQGYTPPPRLDTRRG